MSPHEVVSLYLTLLLRPSGQSTLLDLVKIAVRHSRDVAARETKHIQNSSSMSDVMHYWFITLHHYDLWKLLYYPLYRGCAF